MKRDANIIGRFGALLVIGGAICFTVNFEKIAACAAKRAKGAKASGCCLISAGEEVRDAVNSTVTEWKGAASVRLP